MPCYRNPGIEITRGTITKTRLSADVVIGYPDPIPAGRLSHLYVKTDWHGEPGERNVVLRFRSQTAQSGQILFDGEGAAGSETRTISGNMEILVAIYGQRASVGEAPDVMLDVVIDDEPRGESLPLSVRQPEAVPADAHQILRRELGIALRASRPAAAPEQAIWDRYNGIFEDARAFADPLATQSIGSASVPLVDDRLSDQSFNLQEIRDHLSSSRNPESLANAKAIGKNNAFDLFQGHWRGSWRQNNACGTSMNECEDHEWQEVQRLEPNSKIYVQNGVTGHDSHLYIAPTEDAQPPTCLSLNTPRDVGINVAKAIDTERGTIVGARDVNPRPDEGGVQARCPCVGFYINQGKLLWVVQEALEGDMAVYSVLMETSPGAEVDPVDDQRVATVGFHFKWNRATRQIANAPETKAGQLRKLLTDAERQLEEQFRNRRLQSGHLQDMRYRRRLLRRGVEIYEMRAGAAADREGQGVFGSSGASLHTKAFVVDGETGFVGSYNLDPRSARLNTEMGALFRGRPLAAELRADWEALASPRMSYAVERGPGGALRWRDGAVTPPVLLEVEPQSTLRQRVVAMVCRYLPIQAVL